MIGKKILVGLTYVDKNNSIETQLQLHGIISLINEGTLTFRRSDNHDEFSIPFDGELEESNPELIYTLRTTGEKVTGVNYIASFTIHSSGENDL